MRAVPLIQRLPWLHDQDQHTMTLLVTSIISDDHDKQTRPAPSYYPHDPLAKALDDHQRLLQQFPWLLDPYQHAMTLLVTSVISDHDTQTQPASFYPPYAPLETTPALINLIAHNTEAFYILHTECNLQLQRLNTQDCLILLAASMLQRLQEPAI